ncbi:MULTISPECIES: glycosyltransferase [unclassified Prochlorococcus]|uniref:glycosyltransferase n=1 Tax=unclassified Prochlorococcus TaxID=2627481 RepID=UPI000533A8C5|nr:MULTISPECIES: glycosyltransferase [unclassified Prochlorococcus]KGG16334.1 putative glycosyltransferase [Prochlorococcus sp. MIT 0603]KGG17932.1 putative glycosyltransferase [Prochlorococcus sp. MIT 0602]
MQHKFDVIHLSPSNKIGGAENAARQTSQIRSKYFNFNVFYINTAYHKNFILRQINFLYKYFLSVYNLTKEPPDILIASLWKSYLVALTVSIFRPNTKYIMLLHSAYNKHFAEKIVTSLFSLRTSEIWADSKTSYNNRASHLYFKHKTNYQIISFIFQNNLPFIDHSECSDFIYWGRLSPLKSIDISLRLFSLFSKENTDSKFFIIGPDDGDLERLKSLVRSFNLEEKVFFLGQLNFQQIVEISKKCKFFLQLSKKEGMAMSVVESMQLGLIPIVTSIGEISSYCVDGYNSLIFLDNDMSILVNKIKDIHSDHLRFKAMQLNAFNHWEGKPSYKKSLLKACKDLMINSYT